jgi:hypothetical protein
MRAGILGSGLMGGKLGSCSLPEAMPRDDRSGSQSPATADARR